MFYVAFVCLSAASYETADQNFHTGNVPLNNEVTIKSWKFPDLDKYLNFFYMQF